MPYKDKTKNRAWHKQYTLAHKEERRRSRWRNKYGLDDIEYFAMLEAQGGSCAICKGISHRLLDVDHDHHTNQVRELLCNSCNGGLGLFKDSIQNLTEAVRYLEKHEKIARSSAVSCGPVEEISMQSTSSSGDK